ncbi:MAG: uroporphyrinogen-III synthase [Bryobacterales bacterium]|nr:uroporphyrinogen-III synthase [Bryobacterales bacterium]
MDGQRVVVTRPLDQAAELREMLEAHGAATISIPALEFQPPANRDALDEALRHAGRYEWAIFTSANAVEWVAARAAELGLPSLPALFETARICAIGPATGAVLAARGCRVAMMPAQYVAESVASAFETVPLQGVRVLLPRASVARDVVPDALRERGALVDAVEAYRSALPAASAATVATLVQRGEQVDWVTFTSGSTVTNFLEMGGAPLLKGARIASIGPITSEAAAAHGLRVDEEAEEHTAAGLVAAMLRSCTGSAAPNPPSR